DEQAVVRRRARRLHQLVAGLSVLFLLTAIAAVTAVQSQQAIREQRNIAVSRRVAAEASALRVANPALAAQLSLAAYRLGPTAEARGSVLSTLATPYSTRLVGHTAYLHTAVFRRDGRILVTASADNTARLWDITDPRHPTTLAILTGHTAVVYSAALRPDGRILATASGAHTARLWDITDPRHPTTLAILTGHTDLVYSAAFSPDGAHPGYRKRRQHGAALGHHRP